MIQKTDSAWPSATEIWKEDKTAPERKFGYIFTDDKGPEEAPRKA